MTDRLVATAEISFIKENALRWRPTNSPHHCLNSETNAISSIYELIYKIYIKYTYMKIGFT